VRIYSSFPDALNELKRDIAELGIKVHPQTMQDKNIADDPDYETMEYNNMIYTVTQPRLKDLHDHVKTLDWCEAEWIERLSFIGPGKASAWQLRPEVWEEFAERGFDYTYGQRYADSLWRIISELRDHPDSRQLFMSVWDPVVDIARLGNRRVPCSLGYWFLLRQGKLHITYLQRSADYFTHLANDLYLTRRLQEFVAEEIGASPGNFTHWIGSLHVYKKDVADVF